jgi:hypothetical protein
VNSQRLSSFLLYVCEKTLTGEADSLNERSVGEAVFQRSPDYDPRDDNIVRSHASRLRDRLGEYFEGEGAEETLRVHIRRGSYVPFFEHAVQESEEPAAAPGPSEPVDSATGPDHTVVIPRLWARVGASALACLVFIALLVGGILVRNRELRQMTPVPADSSLVITRLMVGHQIPLADYAGGGYRNSTGCDKPCDPRMVQTVEGLRYTSVSDLEFAVKVTHLPETIMERTVIRYARDLNLKDLKESNLIMAGSQEADPWLSLISGQMSFVVHDDPSAGPLRVENRRPQRGELSEYAYSYHNPQHQGLATIAFLPNLSGNGNLLLVQGFSLAGTQAAAEFVTSGKDLDTLLDAYAGNRTKLPHFEVLLSTTEINGMAAHPTPLAFHVLP